MHTYSCILVMNDYPTYSNLYLELFVLFDFLLDSSFLDSEHCVEAGVYILLEGLQVSFRFHRVAVTPNISISWYQLYVKCFLPPHLWRYDIPGSLLIDLSKDSITAWLLVRPW